MQTLNKSSMKFIMLTELIILLPLINFCYSSSPTISFITDEELKTAGLLTDSDINELEVEKKPNLYNKSYFGGDIVLPIHVREDIYVRFNREKTYEKFFKRMILKLEKYITRSSGRRWSNHRVPYYIDYEYNDRERLLLGAAIVFFERNTCIRWVRRSNLDRSWVTISGSQRGCFSRGIGKSNKGKNELNLEPDCFVLDAIIHEMMHRIGFIHEQARPDRNEFVQVYYQNIIKENEDQFEIRSNLFSYEYGLPYDIHSVMHYDETAFSSNGEPTIVARNGKRLSCNHSGLKCPTDLDIIKINTIYNCPQNSSKTSAQQSDDDIYGF